MPQLRYGSAGRQPVPNTKGRLISSSEDIARLFTVSYTDYSLILRRPSTCLSAYFWMHIAGQRITEGRARALFRQALELVGQNEPRDREQLKSTCAPEKLPAALSKLWPRELPRCCCTNLRASVRWKSATLLGLNAKATASVLPRSTPSCGIYKHSAFVKQPLCRASKTIDWQERWRPTARNQSPT